MDSASVQKGHQVLKILAKSIREIFLQRGISFETLQEIRMRAGKPLFLFYGETEKMLLQQNGQAHMVTQSELRETMQYISHYSLYAYENELRQGFLTIEGGHRIGVSGKAVLEKGQIKTMQYISSVNIRISHEVIGCADPILPYVTEDGKVYHTLIISPPGCGKTTLLRDLIRQISDGTAGLRGCTVGVVDERSELGGCYLGIPQNHLGMRTDILDCCPKAEGMMMLVRSMAPKVIAVDEIGTPEEVRAMEYAMHCGCKLLTSVHGSSMEEIRKRPVIEELIRRRRFERYILLQNHPHAGTVRAIFNERGDVLWQS